MSPSCSYNYNSLKFRKLLIDNTMKKRILKGSNPKILEEESQKLRDKLESLKQQIQMKKKEKEMSKHTSLGESNVARSRTSLQTSSESQKQLQIVLTQLKMEQQIQKINEKGINTYQELIATPIDEIDKWRDIPVGYRIKLKKIIEQNSKNSRISRTPKVQTQQNSPQVTKERDIEQIIKNRKQQKVYVALNRPTQEDQPEDQLDEDDQQVMIQSLINAFQPAFNFDKEEEPNQIAIQSESLEKLQKEESIKPGSRLTNVKQAWSSNQAFPDYKYCWSCLKMLQNSSTIQHNNRQFCSNPCLFTYQSTIEISSNTDFFEQIQHTQEKFNNLIQARSSKKIPSALNFVSAEEEIDFDIL